MPSYVNLNQYPAVVAGPPCIHVIQGPSPHPAVKPPRGEHVVQLVLGVKGRNVPGVLRQSLRSGICPTAGGMLRSHEFQAQCVHAIEHAPVPFVPNQSVVFGGAVDVVEVAGRQDPVIAEVGVPR